jgi:dihydrofolate synthase/folylpolyglutamate synthase
MEFKVDRFLQELQEERVKPGLSRMRYLLRHFNHPEKKFSSLQIAGTNGKGSVIAFMASVLREGGYKVGVYTSPHLFKVNERIALGEDFITDSELKKLLKEAHPLYLQLKERGDAPTYFEIVTLLALLYFSRRNVDFALIEVGVEGKFDATNVISPLLTVITNVEKDHAEFFGPRFQDVKEEMLSLIRKNTPVLTSEEKEGVLLEMEKVCRKKGSPLFALQNVKARRIHSSLNKQSFSYQGLFWHFPKVKISLGGLYQIKNAALSLLTLEVLSKEKRVKLSEEDVLKGMERTFWPARFQILNKEPLVVLDGAHNPSGVRNLLRSLKYYFPRKRFIFVCGVLREKEYRKIAKLLSPYSEEIICTNPPSSRSLSAIELKRSFIRYNKSVTVEENPNSAVEIALKKGEEKEMVVVILGSLYLAAAALDYFNWEVRKCCVR